MKFKFSKKCKKHGLINCPDRKCNPDNEANKIIDRVEKEIKNLNLKKIPKDGKDS